MKALVKYVIIPAAALSVWFAVVGKWDLAITFGNIAFGVGGTKNLLNRKARVDRWNSIPTAIVLSGYIWVYVGNHWMMSIVFGAWGALNWWGLAILRPTEREDYMKAKGAER